MAGNHLPTAKERRRWLAEVSPNLGRAGRELAAAGRWGEALECLEAVGDREGLASLAQQAAQIGDFFTWRRALAGAGAQPSAQDLAQVISAAQAAGKASFAAQAQAQQTPEAREKQS